MKIILAGAGAFALEVEQYILDCNEARRGIFDADGKPVAAATLAGVYFDGSGRLEDFCARPARVAALAAQQDAHWLIAIGHAGVRRKIWRELAAQGARFAKLAHPSSVIARTARLGAGSLLCPFAFAGNRSVLGENTVLNTYASVGHDATIGAHCVFSPHACANGNVTIGETCFLGSFASVTSPGKIGAFCKISAGAVMFGDAEAGCMIAGNPAKSRRLFAVPGDSTT